MMKEEMENNNMIMCHSNRVCGEETKGKHRRNWYCIIFTPYTLNVWSSCPRTSKLHCHICKEKATKKRKKTHLYTIHAKHVTNLPEAIHLLCGICGKRLYRKDKQQYRWHTAETEKWGHLKPPWPCMPKLATTTPRMYKWCNKGYNPRGWNHHYLFCIQCHQPRWLDWTDNNLQEEIMRLKAIRQYSWSRIVSMVQSWNKKKMVPPNLYAIHAKWVTITLKDIQITLECLQWKAVR